MESILIPAKRLTLRPLYVSDLETTAAYALDPGIRYMVHLPLDDKEEALSFLRRVRAEWAKDRPGFFEFAVVLDGKHIGAVSLYREDGVWEAGWIISKGYRGRGFAAEAAGAMMAYFHERFGIRHFTAHCDTENAASVSVMEKLGMVRTGEFPGRRNKGADRESAAYRYDLILPVGPVDPESVRLKPMTPDMYRRYFKEYQSDPALCPDRDRYAPFRYDAAWVERYIRRQADPSRLPLAVLWDDETAGEILLKDIRPRESAVMSVCLKNDAYKGRGIGTAAERAAVRYVFDTLDIPVLTADTLLKNARSQRVLQKAGFSFVREEGGFKYYRIDRGPGPINHCHFDPDML